MTYQEIIILIDWELFNLNGSIIVYRIIFDWVRCSFISVVFLISGLVIYYRNEYIRHESIKTSFGIIVFLFVISIMFLIISPNLIRVILGWDGLGLVSYLLVIYYQNYKSYAAGILTCLRNRIGDSALLIALGWLIGCGNLEFIFYRISPSLELKVACLFIVLAAMTKSAQIPFSSWLPAAIAAPTPVSALVHSSTLVTAGVYLLIRFFPIFSDRWIKYVLFIRGGLTIIISRLGAIYEIDLKKIIALSTLSQLGLIIIALRINLYTLAFFHLLTHALFKASLFLCAGEIIHLYKGSQDVRNLNIISSVLPFGSSCLLICSLALGGFPFLSAFFSKDKIIEESILIGFNILCLLFLLISVMFTIIYRFRLIYYITIESYDLIYESNKDRRTMRTRISLLTIGGIIGGSIIIWIMFDRVYDNLYYFYKLNLLWILLLGGILGLIVKFISINLISFYNRNIWFLPSIRTKILSFISLWYGENIRKSWDKGWNENIGPQGLARELIVISNSFDKNTHRRYKTLLFFSLMALIIMFIIFFCFYSLN